jgi:deazaflavin-dependent oxidoreductase (nitroreductase family)
MRSVHGRAIPKQQAEPAENNAQPAPSAGAEQRAPIGAAGPSPAGTAPARAPSIVRRATRLFNPLVLAGAGTRLLPLYGVIEHHGRRSGKIYHTPVVVRPTREGFIVPMPWGESTDWYRNVRAAGECVIRWKGRAYPVGPPELIDDPAAVRPSFGAFARAAMTRFGIKQWVRLPQRNPKTG